jgi:predicted MFS family arabinose efflux permease
MAVGLGLMALSVPGLSVPDHVLGEAVVMVIVGIAVGVTLAPALPELANPVDRLGGRSYGSVYAVWNEFFAIGMAVGPLAGGLLPDAFTVGATLVVIAAIPLSVYALILVVVKTPSRRQTGRVDGREGGIRSLGSAISSVCGSQQM